MVIAQTVQKVYLIRLVTPHGDAHEVEGYGLSKLEGAYKATHLAEILGRGYSTQDDPPQMREACVDVINLGVDLRHCQVELVERGAGSLGWAQGRILLLDAIRRPPLAGNSAYGVCAPGRRVRNFHRRGSR